MAHVASQAERLEREITVTSSILWEVGGRTLGETSAIFSEEILINAVEAELRRGASQTASGTSLAEGVL